MAKKSPLEVEIRETQAMIVSKMKQREKLDAKITALQLKLRRLNEQKKEDA